MMQQDAAKVSLGVCIQGMLKQFRDVLNIVESPSLGFVTVSGKVGELTAQTLWHILCNIESHWPSAKVYVRCEANHSQQFLALKVINGGGKFVDKLQWSISLVSAWAKGQEIDPLIHTFEGGEDKEGWFVALHVPLCE